MSRIDLTKYIPAEARVIFSSLHSEENRSEIDCAVAAIALPGGRVLDVQWDDDKKEYVIGVFSKHYQQQDLSGTAKTPFEALEYIGEWAKHFCEVHRQARFAIQPTANTHDANFVVMSYNFGQSGFRLVGAGC